MLHDKLCRFRSVGFFFLFAKAGYIQVQHDKDKYIIWYNGIKISLYNCSIYIFFQLMVPITTFQPEHFIMYRYVVDTSQHCFWIKSNCHVREITDVSKLKHIDYIGKWQVV